MLPSSPPPPLRHPRFEVKAQLGEGAEGVVYEAIDREQECRVALKTLRVQDPDRILALKREFRVVADIVHPQLVRLGELFEAQGTWFFTMEFIDGDDFLTHVRGGGGALDEARLRAAFAQLARGLSALHVRKKVHRDIKPSNVRVTPEGRVKVLDFGVARDLAGRGDEIGITGTADYMAPEQALGEETAPASDWYAVGVMLYEALTGRKPFLGDLHAVLEQKVTGEPPPPLDVAVGVPPDLDAFCSRLVRLEPAARPTGPEVIAFFEGTAEAREERTSLESPFVGRDAELTLLDEAFGRVRAGGTASIVLRGASGVGKSRLAHAFLGRLRARGDDVTLLFGRCYERESVPYKALDAIVDELTALLEPASPEAMEALLPADAALLADAFPVFRRVLPISRAPAVARGSGQAPKLRARVFRALRELLTRLAKERPVVLVIDDLQWADADSVSALAEGIATGQVPRLLLLGTARAREGDPATDPIRALGAEEVRVGELLDADARKLAVRLMGTDADERAIASVLAEGHGHPLFLDELVRQRQAHPRGGGALRLDDALWQRVGALGASEQAVLHVVCVAGLPTSLRAVAEAAEVKLDDAVAAVASLRAAHFVRSGGGGETGASVEPYHDRVRESVLVHLDPSALRGAHLHLARALERSGMADGERLFVHWLAAGDTQRAGHHAVVAAEDAARAFAFTRSVTLYRQALALEAGGESERSALLRRLGDALANLGRGPEAAEAYESAARLADVDARLDLERLAGEQLLYAGRLDEGSARLRHVLDELGLKLAATPVLAILVGALFRVFLFFRGLRFEPRAEAEIPRDTLMRLDAGWAVGSGMSQVETVLAAEFSARHVLLCLRTGERFRIARAIALECAFLGAVGGRWSPAVHRLLDRSIALAIEAERPDCVALTRAVSGWVCFFAGELEEATRRFDAASALYAKCGTSDRWVLDTIAVWRAIALAHLGNLPELGRRLSAGLEDARERGDLFLSSLLQCADSNLYLLATEGSGATRDAIAASRPHWMKRGFTVHHLYGTLTTALCDVYDGASAQAVQDLTAMRPRFQATLHFPRLQYARVRVETVWGAASLAAAIESPRARGAASGHLRAARSAARRLRAEGKGYATALGDMIAGGVHAHLGEDEPARVALGAAASGFDASGMALLAAVAQLRLGRVLGGDAGKALETGATRAMTDLGVRDIARLARIFAAAG